MAGDKSPERLALEDRIRRAHQQFERAAEAFRMATAVSDHDALRRELERVRDEVDSLRVELVRLIAAHEFDPPEDH